MTTEQGARFLGEPSERGECNICQLCTRSDLSLDQSIADTSAKTVGSKEGSGFTHATNIEPITYHPSDAFVYLVRINCTIRQSCSNNGCSAS